MAPLTNPAVTATQGEQRFEISDQPVRLRDEAQHAAGTQLVYPNYKERSTELYELSWGDKSAHFSTSDRDGHDLLLGFSDNWYLHTADGAVWLKYEDGLYRME
ncbi:MAG: hypothetical protein IPL65_17560 [Lewinellaceae bacterium]|nr:hypothetical protein [Lewinellaceae bacterium]